MQRSVTLLVLGDLGRSPRMMYHLESFLKENFKVRVVAYLETPLPEQIRSNPDVQFYRLNSPSAKYRHQLPKPLFLAYSLLRVIKQFFILLNILFRKIPYSDSILIQNPPSFPALLVASWIADYRGMKLIIDWHNFGYSILGMRFGDDHFVVRTMKWFERYYSKKADCHLCVSQAMKAYLENEWDIKNVICFYDSAPEKFRKTKTKEILYQLDLIPDKFENAKILVSSSSWTEDENFHLLLDAVKNYDQINDIKKLLIILTGKGSGQSKFEHQVSLANLKKVRIKTVWLEDQEYIDLLSASDLGLSFHTSSSGLDLPMKISDMLGAGLPVCAFDYGPTIREQIQENCNGLLFKSSSQLTQHLVELFNSENVRKLNEMHEWIKKYPTQLWHSSWLTTMDPLFKSYRGRICFLHPTLGLGGAERWVVNTVVSLKKAGYEVEVFTGEYAPEMGFSELITESIKITVSGKFLPTSFFQRVQVLCALLKMAWVSLRLRFSGKHYDLLICDLVSHTLPLLGKGIAEQKIFYGHYPDQYLTAPRTGWYRYYRRIFDQLEETGLSFVDHVIVNSKFTQSKFLQAFPKIETSVCYPGIDIRIYQEIEPVSENLVDSNKIVLLVFGRIFPDKNISLAIETLAKLKSLNKSWFNKIELIIAGGYNKEDHLQVDELKKLKDKVDEAKLNEQIYFKLNCDDTELIEFYRQSSVLLYTSTFEHFGLVPLEAMASARPVIASDQGGPTETIINNKTGFLTETSAEQFMDRVLKLIETPGLARKMGEEGRIHVSERFARAKQSMALLQGSTKVKKMDS
ncbi:MAG: glycosyltransferase [Gammaproteobacteria bacterium]